MRGVAERAGSMNTIFIAAAALGGLVLMASFILTLWQDR
jgi:hypothetical protein